MENLTLIFYVVTFTCSLFLIFTQFNTRNKLKSPNIKLVITLRLATINSIFIILMAVLAIITLVLDKFDFLHIFMSILYIISAALLFYSSNLGLAITDTGIGKTSIFKKTLFDYTPWKNIRTWRWSNVDKCLLIFEIISDSKVINREWTIPERFKSQVNDLFNKYSPIN